jgi:hypothetical protein
MAAWRLTKAESCGVNWDDELPPVKPPASFQASHATPNTNKLNAGRIIQAHTTSLALPTSLVSVKMLLLVISIA